MNRSKSLSTFRKAFSIRLHRVDFQKFAKPKKNQKKKLPARRHTNDALEKMKKNTTPSLDLRGDETSLLLLLFLYTLQGIPIGLAGSLPFLLQERGTSLTQQSMFSIASYPFSFKVLWAPILDAVFLKRFGRRKSWLVPVQILTGVAMIVGSSWLPVALDAEKPDVAGLTAYFFLYTL